MKQDLKESTTALETDEGAGNIGRQKYNRVIRMNPR